MYNKVLIGYDDSEYSMAAVKEVAAWLGRHGGEAELIHGVYFDNEEFGIKPELLGKRILDGEKACTDAQKIADAFGITMNTIIREGDPPEVILNKARENGTDLIALGSHGRKGISRMIIGSVTANVIADSPCDVLVVKRPCSDCTGQYASILVPYDGSPSSNKALDSACALAKLDDAEVTAIYVIPRYEEMINFFMTEGVRNILNAEARKILDHAEKRAAAYDVEIRTLINDGSPSENIVDTAAKDNVDLIIMGSYGWRGFNKSIIGSTAERVIMEADRPVLVTR